MLSSSPLLTPDGQAQMRSCAPLAKALLTGTIPPARGLPPLALARWLQRETLLAGAAWRPMVCVDGPLDHDGDRLLDCVEQAAGGALVIGPSVPAADRRALGRAAEQRGVTVMTISGDPVTLPPALHRAVEVSERAHLVASDPALTPLRQALLAHARAGGFIHLTGEPGTGKRALVRWAHRLLSDVPLAHIGAGQRARISPGRWLLVDELSELDTEQRAQLEQRVNHTRGAPPAYGPVARPTLPAFRPILGHSPAVSALLIQAARAAVTPHPALILGESGTGKEVLARAIHEASGRGGPFVAVDLSAINEELIESELFGHIKGAFTGADSHREGAFRSAHGGTLFLDELGNIRPSVQARLLRVLQERRVRPVGSDRTEAVDVRVLAATNADLDGMMAAGTFREDLVMRLNTFTLHLPPLRHREGDAVFLAKRFLAAERPGDAGFDAEALEALERWWWPGNVRELENAVRRAAAHTDPGQPVAREALGLPRPGAEEAPVVSTHSGPANPDNWGLSRRTIHRLTAVTLHLPPLRDRPPRDRRHLILSLLAGRPVSTEALDLLASHPWWGNLTELEQALEALLSATPGALTEATVSASLPHLVGIAGHRPIRVLLDPAVDDAGALRGLRERFEAGNLVVGRARDAQEIEGLIRAAPTRHLWLEPHIRHARPAVLSLPRLHKLSRAHLLVTRTPRGLSVAGQPGGSVQALAGPLEAGGSVRPVTAEGRPIGRAGEILLQDSRGELLAQLFLFEGAVAWDEHARSAARRVRTAAAGPTLATVAPSGQPKHAVNPRERWALDTKERAALVRTLAGFPGGRFAPWLRGQVAKLQGDPALRRLCAYFLSAPNVGDYCGRLVAYEVNGALREALSTAVDAETLARLPASVRAALA